MVPLTLGASDINAVEAEGLISKSHRRKEMIEHLTALKY